MFLDCIERLPYFHFLIVMDAYGYTSLFELVVAALGLACFSPRHCLTCIFKILTSPSRFVNGSFSQVLSNGRGCHLTTRWTESSWRIFAYAHVLVRRCPSSYACTKWKYQPPTTRITYSLFWYGLRVIFSYAVSRPRLVFRVAFCDSPSESSLVPSLASDLASSALCIIFMPSSSLTFVLSSVSSSSHDLRPPQPHTSTNTLARCWNKTSTLTSNHHIRP
ncbi:hypothetical protein V8F33_011301 [Rhypophila sp. PSN 637]